MALIETNFIRPQEVYDRNTGESKVRYRSYDGNDRFIPVVEGENGVPKTLVEVTHAELKAMRDAGKLTPGALYRITDYNCTTTQENTQSANHQFDIVLLALNENKLAEEGWAMMHDNIYDVTFDDGVTLKCYLYKIDEDEDYTYYNIVRVDTLAGVSYVVSVEINEDNKTAYAPRESTELTEENLTYNYFQNSNLSAWKVWYCLDNDTARFAWADDAETQQVFVSYWHTRDASKDINGYYAWYYADDDSTVFTKTLEPTIGTAVYDPEEGTQEDTITNIKGFGRGVIYRLIDEFNNDIKYDFKNIQFKRKITDGQYDATNGTETWCYTLNVWYNNMCQDASIVGNTLPNDEDYVEGVHDNNFGYATTYDIGIDGVNTFAFALGNNVVLSYDDDGYFGTYSNTIGNSFYNNTIEIYFRNNTIGNSFFNNTIRTHFESNTIGNSFYNNTIRGDYFSSNMIGNSFIDKTISDNTNYKNYGNNGVELATKS